MRLKLNRINNQWEEKEEGEEYDLFLDNFLFKKLQNIELLQKNNWDCFFLIIGKEGSGKSTLAFICGQYLTKMGLTLDNIANGTDDALEKLQRLPDESVIIIDEAELLFSSRDTLTREQRQLMKIIMIIRQKKMVLILVTPSFFELNKYIAVDRTRFLLRVYANNKLQRGYWSYWGEKDKRTLYANFKKYGYSYLKPKPLISGRYFDYKLPFDKEYQKVKFETLMLAFEKKNTRQRTKFVEKEEEGKEKDNSIP